MHVFVEGRKVTPDPARSIGKGGEADVFDVGEGRALKLFKPPDHPDLAGLPEEQEAARRRLEVHQAKLRTFPQNLPERVIAPLALATRRDGRIAGYTMRLLQGTFEMMRFGDPAFRRAGGDAQQVVDVLRDLHGTVDALHARAVVIGDFNDLNVLVDGTKAWMVDADSFQFPGFPCPVFTERFVDPLLCDPAAARLTIVRPHTPDSDWYAYAVMALRSLLMVDPYGGVHRPPDATRKVAAAVRALRRISVFDRDVLYPKAALRPEVLPDDLLHHFHHVFMRDRRGSFPRPLLDGLRWTRCSACGAEHARAVCPACHATPPGGIREATIVRGEVTARTILRTRGVVLAAALGEEGRLRWLVEEDGVLRRENGAVVMRGRALPGMRFGLLPAATLVGCDETVVRLQEGHAPERLAVDAVGRRASFEVDGRQVYRVRDGRLVREGALGPERIGEVLARQTFFWVGRDFGAGFYRAGGLSVGFVFDALGHALNDGVRLPPLRGQLLDADAVFSGDRCWLLTSCAEGARTINRAALVRRDGRLEGLAEAEAGSGTWLDQIRGGCGAGASLLLPTDRGVVRVEADGGLLVETRVFVDTEPFVDAGSRLLGGRDALYVVGRREILEVTLCRA